MPHYVYILESRDRRYYTGYTTDVQRRMKAHQSGRGARFTKAFGFRRLLYWEELPSRSAALKREAEIKKMKRPVKKDLIRRYFPGDRPGVSQV